MVQNGATKPSNAVGKHRDDKGGVLLLRARKEANRQSFLRSRRRSPAQASPPLGMHLRNAVQLLEMIRASGHAGTNALSSPY